MDSLLDVLIPPLFGLLGIQSIFRAWKCRKNIEEVKDAVVISDKEATSKTVKKLSMESGAYVAISGKLQPLENMDGDVITTRRKFENIDKLFTSIETTSPVRVRNCLLERSLGRSLYNFGRTRKERLLLEAPHNASCFDSLFTETKTIDVAQRHTLLNTEILRVTEEALLAGVSVTVLAQLDLDGGEICLRAPLSWHKLFIISARSLSEIVEDLQEEMFAYRRTAVLAAAGILVYYIFRTWSEQRPSRELQSSRSYDSVELDTESACVVCIEAQPDMLLLDCGHAILCQRCAARVTSCPLCRTEIQTPPCRIFIS